jgi:hypothetical protein
VIFLQRQKPKFINFIGTKKYVLFFFSIINKKTQIIYPDILKNMFVPNFFEAWAILAPNLEVVEEINNYVLSLMLVILFQDVMDMLLLIIVGLQLNF